MPPSQFTLEKIVTPGDCETPDTCNFVLGLDINVPIPTPACPTFNVTQFSVLSGYAAANGDPGCANGTSYFRVVPNITPGTCNSPDTCDFGIEAEIVVPIPRPPCPQINLNSFNVVSGYSQNNCLQNDVSLFDISTRHIPGDGCNEPDQCIFDVDLSIAIPIPPPVCPTINVTKFEVGVALTGREYDEDNNPLDIKCVVEPVSKLSVPYTEEAYRFREALYCVNPPTFLCWKDFPKGCPWVITCETAYITYALYNGAVGSRRNNWRV